MDGSSEGILARSSIGLRDGGGRIVRPDVLPYIVEKDGRKWRYSSEISCFRQDRVFVFRTSVRAARDLMDYLEREKEPCFNSWPARSHNRLDGENCWNYENDGKEFLHNTTGSERQPDFKTVTVEVTCGTPSHRQNPHLHMGSWISTTLRHG